MAERSKIGLTSDFAGFRGGDVPEPFPSMKKLLSWAMAAGFVILVMWVVFRWSRLRAIVTGQAPAAS